MLLGWLVIVITILVFIQFIRHNPAVWWQLKNTSPATLALVLLGYAVMTGLLAVLYKAMTDVCRVAIPAKENLLLTMYSSVINFFGPLQSGPGFRLVYLKKRYKVNIPAYVGVSVLYYVCFAVASGLMLLSGLFGWWILAVVILAPIGLYFGLPRFTKTKLARKFIPQQLPLKALGLLMLLSTAQVLVVAIIYFIELSSVRTGVSFSQAIVYTGAANFALFVSLTPGALGFRESFLYFSRDLHHINESTIVAANILDRGVYVLFLGILFVIILALHGHQRFTRVRLED
jgi:uncharacterized membrane protein YbhN (UPF0104 family)